MTELTWQRALQSLLAYYKVPVQNVPEKGAQKDIEELLLGSGLSVRPMRGGASSFGALIDGALLGTESGTWLPVVLFEGQSYILTEEGRRGPSLTNKDMEKVVKGYVFSQKEYTADRLLTFYRRHKKQVLQIIACGFFVNTFGLFLPIFSSFVYDKILGNQIHETLWALAIGLLFVAVIDFAVRAVRTLIAERFAISSEADIDREIFRGLLAAKVQTMPSIGSFLDRYKRILSSRDFLSSSYLLSLIDIPFLLLFALAIFYAAGFMVVVPLVFGLLLMLGNLVTSIPLYDYDRQSRGAEEKKFKIITDLMMAHEVISGSHLSKEMAAKWREASSKTTSLQSLSRYWKNIGANFSGSLTFLSYIAVLIVGVYMVDNQTLSSGGLLAASMLSSRMMNSFSSIVTIVLRHKDFKTSLAEMNAILPSPIKDKGECADKKLSGRIVFDNVTCRLKENAPPVLSGITTRINNGEMVGIAGIPGSGKTTLMRLICGVVQAETGEVLIDHYPVRSLRPEDLAPTIGYKPQDFCLIDGTIESNVRAGGLPLTPEQREHVLTTSGLGWVFQQGGLDWTTEVGPCGNFLSGGQKQLVALARAFLDKRPILLLDEPTNGLDSHLQTHLVKQLTSMKGSSTILISTHSRELLSICDKIIVVGDARIMADGLREKILVA